MATEPADAVLLDALTGALDEPSHIDADPQGGNQAITIYAFDRNFVDDCDEDAADNPGFVLVTAGMCRQRMPALPDGAEDDGASRAVELIWYVKTLDPAYFAQLRWLATLPQIDKIAFYHGRTVSMPSPPLASTPFKTFLLLPPIYGPDAELFDGIETPGGDAVTTLTVHLISDAERAMIQRGDDGLDDFLDLLDERDHPMLFDPARTSYV
jgi:Suppressor of fused protein (SUFU)